jgi:exopolysaccharide production protein ExoQ
MLRNMKNSQLFWRTFEIVIVILWLACLNASAIKEFDQFPRLDTLTGRGWQIALSYVGVALSVLIVLQEKKLQPEIIKAWLNNIWLLIFLAFSVTSLFWSVERTATFYEIILLVCSTFIASYIALRFNSEGVIDILTWFAAISTLMSLAIVFFVPEIGTMLRPGHAGSWRGLFWHRNHTGSMMAFFNMVFLLRFLTDPILGDKNLDRRKRFIFGIFYILTAIHVFGSQSATGKIIFFSLNLLSFVVLVWMKWRSKIKAWHYYAAFAAFAGLVYLVAANLEIVFQLLNRDPSMTGRTSMWPDLLYNTYLARPLLGHGFATIWTQESFRILIQHRWGWGYQPYFADNGYIDILLNLGAVGLAIFLYGAILVVKRFVILLNKHNSREAIFLLMILVYAFIANVAYSFLFEVDYFVWSLIVLAAFISVKPSETNTFDPLV